VVLNLYTVNSTFTSPTAAYNASKKYYEPDYVNGSPMVPPSNCNIQFIPFSMVIDLTTMTVLGADTMNVPLGVQQILGLVNQANN
jgi:hypothetical protein